MTTSQAREYVAAEVRAALARDGRSAAQLASDSGIPRSSLSKKLRAQVSLTVEELLAISTALSIDPGTLVPPAEAIAA
jgi:transcriptional regulator with XRE-family HTH domain